MLWQKFSPLSVAVSAWTVVAFVAEPLVDVVPGIVAAFAADMIAAVVA